MEEGGRVGEGKRGEKKKNDDDDDDDGDEEN